MFGFFLEQQDPVDQFRFGREADGSPAAPWGWEDLNLWPVPRLREPGRRGRARTSRPPRWSADCRLSACSGSSLSRTAALISFVSAGRPMAPRPRHGVGKTWTYGFPTAGP
jgi:hypothetical protein